MTDIDTALLDGLIDSIVTDTPITRTFSAACSMMSLEVGSTNDRSQQLRQMMAKLVEMPRPARRLALMRLAKKLLSDDRVEKHKDK
jgi:hypothetical protein